MNRTSRLEEQALSIGCAANVFVRRRDRALIERVAPTTPTKLSGECNRIQGCHLLGKCPSGLLLWVVSPEGDQAGKDREAVSRIHQARAQIGVLHESKVGSETTDGTQRLSPQQYGVVEDPELVSESAWAQIVP